MIHPCNGCAPNISALTFWAPAYFVVTRCTIYASSPSFIKVRNLLYPFAFHAERISRCLWRVRMKALNCNKEKERKGWKTWTNESHTKNKQEFVIASPFWLSSWVCSPCRISIVDVTLDCKWCIWGNERWLDRGKPEAAEQLWRTTVFQSHRCFPIMSTCHYLIFPPMSNCVLFPERSLWRAGQSSGGATGLKPISSHRRHLSRGITVLPRRSCLAAVAASGGVRFRWLSFSPRMIGETIERSETNGKSVSARGASYEMSSKFSPPTELLCGYEQKWLQHVTCTVDFSTCMDTCGYIGNIYDETVFINIYKPSPIAYWRTSVLGVLRVVREIL